MQSKFWRFSLRVVLVALGSAVFGVGVNPVQYRIYSLSAQEINESALDAQVRAEANRLLILGLEQFDRGQFRDAIASWQSSLELYRASEDRQGEIHVLVGLGEAYRILREEQAAIVYYEQSLQLARTIEDVEGEANALDGLGGIYRSLGEYRAAIAYYEQSLEIFRVINDVEREAGTLNNLGIAHSSIGEDRTARDYFEESLEISQAIRDVQGEAQALNNLGATSRHLGEYRTAIAYHEQSLEIFQSTGNEKGEAASLTNLGLDHHFMGAYRTAITYHEQSLGIFRSINDAQGESEALGNLGSSYIFLGEYQTAIAYHEQSLEIFQAIEYRKGEANAANNLGSIYSFLGDYEAAIAYFEQSLENSRVIEDSRGEAYALGNLGLVYNALGEYQVAIAYLNQSLDISRLIGDVKGELSALNNLGIAYEEIGEHRTAIAHHEQSLEISRATEDLQGEANSLNSLGNAYRSLGEHRAAIAYHEQSLEISRAIEDLRGEASTLNNIGLSYLTAQQYTDAEQSLLEAIAIFETLRGTELPDINKVSLFETQRISYVLLQQALVTQGKTNPALEIAERSRARALVELLSDRVSERTTKGITISIPSLNAIQRVAQQQDATLVSYSIINTVVGDPSLYIWVIQPTGNVSFQSVDLSPLNTLLSDLIILSRSNLGVRSRNVPDGDIALSLPPEELQRQREQQRQSLNDLYNILIAPIAESLPTNESDRIIFIPQGELFLVPFAALVDNNDQYLIENHTLSIAPSIQTLALTRQLQNPNVSLTDNPLIVGNPTMPRLWSPETNTNDRLPSLPGAENEARAIAQQLNTEALLWDNASETRVAQQMQNASLIHLATHGLLDYGTPGETGIRDVPGAIALAPDSTNDGLLTSAEIFTMQLQTNLVVLSACDTGRGTITGDGVIGLSRSLMQAGVPSVVVSLWSVPDDSTEFLMKEFYANLDEMDKAQALRQAMLSTMQQSEYTEPLDWAAFTLIGEAN